MSARKIPTNRRSLTGVMSHDSSEGIAFESSLERDFVEFHRFRDEVLSIVSQPVTISYFNPRLGRASKYTPDYKIVSRQPFGKKTITTLYEVKYRSDFWEQWRDIKPALKAARAYARGFGWGFEIYTEVEIRTQYLKNVRFLAPYLRDPYDGGMQDMIAERVRAMRTCTVTELLGSLFQTQEHQAQALSVIWRMVANRSLGMNLDLPITMSSTLWLSKDTTYE